MIMVTANVHMTDAVVESIEEIILYNNRCGFREIKIPGSYIGGMPLHVTMKAPCSSRNKEKLSACLDMAPKGLQPLTAHLTGFDTFPYTSAVVRKFPLECSPFFILWDSILIEYDIYQASDEKRVPHVTIVKDAPPNLHEVLNEHLGPHPLTIELKTLTLWEKQTHWNPVKTVSL